MNNSRPASSPEITVVVPALNEADSIRTLLDSLLTQTLPPQEIIITDAGSNDGTPDIVEEFIRTGAPVRLMRETCALPGRARNVAAANANSEWIAFTDAGINPEPNWLEALSCRAANDENIDVVYGTYDPETRTLFEECAAIAYVPPPAEVDGGMARSQSIVSALMRREVWKSVGGFPEDLRSAEDLLFMRKIEQAGFRIVRAPEAVVHWNLQPNLWRTFKRFSAYARNNIRAGLFAEWQGTIFIYYALIGASAVSHLRFGLSALLGPPLLWLLFMSVRSAKALYRNRKVYPAWIVRVLIRFVFVAVILAVIDAATFAGSIDWLLRDKLGFGK